MKVWLVEAVYDYNRTIVLGVYGTEQKALNEQEVENKSGEWDGVDVYEMEVK
jgi:hypothetical protein